MIRLLLISLMTALLSCCSTTASPLKTDINWQKFLANQDPVWEQIPRKWYEAPVLGNGRLGTLIRQTGAQTVRWDAGSSEVVDHRQNDNKSVRSPEVLNRGRLFIGHFILKTSGTIKSGNIHLDLYNAEARGTITTDKGSIAWRTFVHAEDMCYLVELTPSSGENGCTFNFVPEKAISPRVLKKRIKRYKHNPDPVSAQQGDINYCEHKLLAGGKTTTAWKQEKSENTRRFYITIQHNYPHSNSTELAIAELEKCSNSNLSEWTQQHRDWWHSYYPQSFITLPDSNWESFYWIQMYKLASATRADRDIIDNQGPWLQPTAWNSIWWNLNVQLSYSQVATANRLELGECLNNHFRKNFNNLILSVDKKYQHDSAALSRHTSPTLLGLAGEPGNRAQMPRDIGSEVGNLPWMCHMLYNFYLHSQNEKDLTELVYPLLKRSINYYRHFLFTGEDGKLHLPETHSPEYGNSADCNFDLTMIRWGCKTLIEINRQQKLKDPLLKEWQNILDKLTPYVIGSNGFKIGKGEEFKKSHRHWSHMISVYPFHDVTPESGDSKLIAKSLDHWHSFKGALEGYSFTGGGSIAALLGDGNRSLELLDGLKGYLQAGTMYKEASGPVMETPLHGSQVLQEMLLQCRHGKILVFPAVPDKWQDASFHNFRAAGAFLISAQRQNGRNQWVRIKSLKGKKCLIKVNIGKIFKATNGVKISPAAKGYYEVHLEEGQETVLYTGSEREFSIKPIANKGANPFGIKKGGKLIFR